MARPERMSLLFMSGAGGGGVSPIDPASIPSAILSIESDLDVFSDAGTTPAVDGSAVQQWNDQVGSSNFIQLVGGSKPTYDAAGMNGGPDVVFSGDYMAVVGSNISPPYTIMSVANCGNTNGYVFDGTPFDKGGISYSAGDARLMTDGGSLSVPGRIGQNIIITAINSGDSNGYLQVNDDIPATGPASGDLVAPFQLGGIAAGGGFSCNGPLNALAVFGAVLTANQIAGVKLFWRNKYGIT